MAEFIYIDEQTAPQKTAALLNDAIPCPRGLIMHRPGSGLITLRGNPPAPCAKFARYEVEFEGNISVPTDGTVGEIDAAIAISGEILPSSIAAATPTVVGAYWHVGGSAVIDVMPGCCTEVTIENASVTDTPINFRNLKVRVNRRLNYGS